MLAFFRKYQRYFFIAITTVIVISFSFFGTSSTLQTPQTHHKIAFKAIDGSDIRQLEVDEMVLFLNMDPDEKLDSVSSRLSFLNAGVFRNEIMATGLAEIIAKDYLQEIKEDLLSKQSKESAYRPYVHPQAPFISTENAWATFAPALKEAFTALQQEDAPASPQAMALRAKLFLETKQIPPALLRQIFKYQERQFSWLTPDENLDRLDLSLFGYHTPEDWFGPRFMRIAAEFVINCAKIAEERGYQVSKSEAAADLHYNAELAFNKILQENRYAMAFASSDEYLADQLRRLGLDENQAAKTWRNVLLFRRLFQEAGNMVFIDHTAFKAFNDFAEETAEGQIYALPQDLKLSDFQQLQKFEIYLSAIAKKRKNLLKLPVDTLSTALVLKKHPELVQKRYLLEISMLDQQALTSKVSIKETWNWEADEQNWALLTKEFPELGIKHADSLPARIAALDALDASRRSAVDAFASKAIVANHPQWIEESLKEALPKREVVAISYQGESTDIRGLKDGATLIALLDQAPLKESEQADEQSSNADKLAAYSADGRHYYRIRVIERLDSPEVMTFGQANKKGLLDALLNKELEKFYASQKEKAAASYQKEDQSFKPFADVKEDLAKKYFKGILTAIAATEKGDLSVDALAQRRFVSYVEEAKKAIQQGPERASSYISASKASAAEKQLQPASNLNEQWKLEARPLNIARNDTTQEIDATTALAMPNGEWSAVHALPNGTVFFFHKLEQKKAIDQGYIVEGVEKTRSLFYNAVQKSLGQQLVELFKEKNAISLNYLDTGSQIQAE